MSESAWEALGIYPPLFRQEHCLWVIPPDVDGLDDLDAMAEQAMDETGLQSWSWNDTPHYEFDLQVVPIGLPECNVLDGLRAAADDLKGIWPECRLFLQSAFINEEGSVMGDMRNEWA